jgi:hypothetical protein
VARNGDLGKLAGELVRSDGKQWSAHAVVMELDGEVIARVIFVIFQTSNSQTPIW